MTIEAGQQFTAEISYVTRNGLGTVEEGHDNINIGPVDCEKGRRVRLRYLGKQEEKGNDVGFAICLTDDVIGDDYDEYIQNIIDELIPDRPPELGEETYATIDRIGKRDLAITELGGEEVQLGPVRADEGDIVRIIGTGGNYAEVQPSAKGENYDIRLRVLAGHTEDLPIQPGDEIKTVIADATDDSLIGYVGEAFIRFPPDAAEVAQKVRARVTGFEQDQIVGQVIETLDEVGRIERASHWARMQWLRRAGFEDNPLLEFAQTFTQQPATRLPDSGDRLRDTLIGEAIRYAIADKTDEAGGSYPRVHISGLRHWVLHKLAAVLGNPSSNEDVDDWFRAVLTDRAGPTITFLGDIQELAEGYYAPAPTRAVMISDTEAVLLSGRPTVEFTTVGLDVEFRGVARILRDVGPEELSDVGIPVQSQDAYTGLADEQLLSESDLETYITSQPREPWEATDTWEVYTGQYGFQQDEDPLTVVLGGETEVSFWKVPIEYGADQYQLRVLNADEQHPAAVSVPRRYAKHITLLLEAVDGLPQRVEMNNTPNGTLVSCDFAPPRPQVRWLHAIGGEFRETPSRDLQWLTPDTAADSVADAFEPLPVTITTTT